MHMKGITTLKENVEQYRNEKTNLMTKYGFTNNNLSTSKLNVSNITRIQKLILMVLVKIKLK